MKNLTENQINYILQMQLIGRLGAVNGDTPYVVPIAFVFDGKSIYARSRDGEKIRIMRSNPKICFQVDAIDDLNNWRSVMLTGTFEELKTTSDCAYAASLLHDRFSPILINDVTQEPVPESQSPKRVEKARKAIYFRINIREKHGRYELVSPETRARSSSGHT